MQEVLENDGIPIVHVPRSSIVKAILDADDFERRVKIIEDNTDDIADDCEKALDCGVRQLVRSTRAASSASS